MRINRCSHSGHRLQLCVICHADTVLSRSSTSSLYFRLLRAVNCSSKCSHCSSSGTTRLLVILCLTHLSSSSTSSFHFCGSQAMNHSQLASEMAKLKSPFINRNYLELAMLVCNTFRGKLFPCPHCRYVTDRRNNLKRHVSTMHQACDKVSDITR